MTIGDLIKINPCPEKYVNIPFEGESLLKCLCFFCSSRSNRVGIVLSPGTHDSWHAMFDCGEATIRKEDIQNGLVKIISNIPQGGMGLQMPQFTTTKEKEKNEQR